jgi:plasmid maintenance system antidote protein VapI
MNRQLRSAIFLLFDRQSDAAQAMGLPESRLSKIIHYRIPPSDKERRALARVFGAERANALLGGENRREEAGS